MGLEQIFTALTTICNQNLSHSVNHGKKAQRGKTIGAAGRHTNVEQITVNARIVVTCVFNGKRYGKRLC